MSAPIPSSPPPPKRRPAFTPAIDALVREIDSLGAHQQLWRYLYRNRRDTPLDKIESDLTAMRDQLRATAPTP